MPKKIYSFLLISIFSVSFWLNSNNIVYADAVSCTPNITYKTDPQFIPEQTKSINITFSNQSDGWYRLRFYEKGLQVYTTPFVESIKGKVTINIDDSSGKLDRREHTITLLRADDSSGKGVQDYCGFIKFSVGYDYSTCRMIFTPSQPTDQQDIGVRVVNSPSGNFNFETRDSNGKIQIVNNFGSINVGNDGTGTSIVPKLNKPITLTVSLIYNDLNPIPALNRSKEFCKSTLTILPNGGQSVNPSCFIIPSNSPGGVVKIQAINLPKNSPFRADLDTQNVSGNVDSANAGSVIIDLGTNIPPGLHTGYLWDGLNQQICAESFEVNSDGTITSSTTGATQAKKCDDPKTCSSAGGVSCDPESGKAGTGGILTAIGCVPTEPKALVEGILKVTSFGIGAVALLLMVLGAFKMITSDGNAETIQAGKDQFTAAFLGLLFIIFSVLLLQVIGVDILNLPGFGR